MKYVMTSFLATTILECFLLRLPLEIGIKSWVFHEDGSKFGIGQISSGLPNEICNDKLLGNDSIGVLITKIATRDRDQIMGIVQWPLRQAKLPNHSLMLVDVIEFVCVHCIIESEDDDEGIKKALIELYIILEEVQVCEIAW